MTEFKKFQVFEILKLLINKLITSPRVDDNVNLKKKKKSEINDVNVQCKKEWEKNKS